MTHRNWGVPPRQGMQRFDDRYYTKEPVIERTKTRDRIVVLVMVSVAIVATMWFWQS